MSTDRRVDEANQPAGDAETRATPAPGAAHGEAYDPLEDFAERKSWWCSGHLRWSKSGGRTKGYVNFGESCGCGETQTAMVNLSKDEKIPLEERQKDVVQKVLDRVNVYTCRSSPPPSPPPPPSSSSSFAFSRSPLFFTGSRAQFLPLSVLLSCQLHLHEIHDVKDKREREDGGSGSIRQEVLQEDEPNH